MTRVNTKIRQHDWLAKNRTFSLANHVAELLFLVCVARINWPVMENKIKSLLCRLLNNQRGSLHKSELSYNPDRTDSVSFEIIGN